MSAAFDRARPEDFALPQKKEALNRRLFDVVAPRYDFITVALSLGRDQAWKRHLIAEFPRELNPGKCVDLASGTGDIAARLARRFPRAAVAGLDLTPGMLDIARQRHVGLEIEWIAGSMHELPWPDASVDIVTGGYALRNAPDLQQALGEIARILRDGGTAAFLDFSKPTHRLGQRFSLFLLKIWGALWGTIVHRNPHVYGYIADSLRRYPDRVQLRRHFESHQLEVLRTQRFFGGLLECVVCRRRPRVQ